MRVHARHSRKADWTKSVHVNKFLVMIFLAPALCLGQTNILPFQDVRGTLVSNAVLTATNSSFVYYQTPDGPSHIAWTDLPAYVQKQLGADPAAILASQRHAEMQRQEEAAQASQRQIANELDAADFHYRFPGYHLYMGRGWARFPLRVFGAQVFNLAPLYYWWTNAGQKFADSPIVANPTNIPPRPLPGWYHVYGEIVGVGFQSWLVKGQVELKPGYFRDETFYVLHPPELERQRFIEAKARLAEIGQQNGEPPRRYDAPLVTIDSTVVYGISASPAAVREQAEPYWQTLDTIPMWTTNYTCDFFALKTGYDSHREVFDMGAIRANPPVQ